MKFAKWLVIAVCAIFCCACSKNNPIAYVDEDADLILYFDTTEELNKDQKELLRRLIPDVSGLRSKIDEDDDKLDFYGIDLYKTPAKLAFWGKADEKDGSFVVEDMRAVMVLKDNTASDLLNDCKEHWEKNGKDSKWPKYVAEKETIDGCDAMLFKLVTPTYDRNTGKEKDEEKLEYTIIVADKNKLQFFFGEDKPSSLLKPENKCEMAKKIKSKYIIATAVSGDYRTEQRDDLAKHHENVDEFDFGDVVSGVYFSGDEFRSESIDDISKVVK